MADDNSISYVPYSGLASLLRGHMRAPIGYDSEQHKDIYAATQAELDSAENDAETAATSLSMGLAVIGKLMMSPGVLRKLSDHDIGTVGDLITTLGETIGALSDVARAAGDGLPSKVAAAV